MPGAIRRVVSIGLLMVAALGLTLGLPILPLIAILDLLRRARWALVRTYLFLCVLAGAELVGVAVTGLLWFDLSRGTERGRARWLAAHYRLQRAWVWTLYESARRLFGLDIQVEGLARAEHGPYLLILRHVSVADTLLPTRLVSGGFGLRLRFVLKRDLLWDPCLDIVGQRLPNAFVSREAQTRPEDLAAVAQLCEGLGPADGVLIYPEGTRATAARRARALEKLASSAPELHARAAALRHLLPPRLGGVSTVLAARPDLDVVVCAHTGFEGTTRLSDFWRGALIGRRVWVAFWRVPAERIPKDERGRTAFMYEQWAEVDAWIETKAQAETRQ